MGSIIVIPVLVGSQYPGFIFFEVTWRMKQARLNKQRFQ